MKKVCLVLWSMFAETGLLHLPNQSEKGGVMALFCCCWLRPLSWCLSPMLRHKRQRPSMSLQAVWFDQVNPAMAEIYAQWEKSHHARPLMGVKGGLMLTHWRWRRVKKALRLFKDDPRNENLEFPCFKCHLPQALLTLRTQLRRTCWALIAKDLQKSESYRSLHGLPQWKAIIQEGLGALKKVLFMAKKMLGACRRKSLECDLEGFRLLWSVSGLAKPRILTRRFSEQPLWVSA